MRKAYIVIGALLSVILLASGIYVLFLMPPRIPKPPPVPPRVLAVWDSPPSPRGVSPDISEEVILEPFPGEWVGEVSFFLAEGQWIDVIVASHIPVYFDIRHPASVEFDIVSGKQIVRALRRYPAFHPLLGKLLYENEVTVIGKETVYTTAVRIFAWDGAMSYYVDFENLDPDKPVVITTEIYKLAITPGWGEPYRQELKSWLRTLQDETMLPREEIIQIYKEWLEQFH